MPCQGSVGFVAPRYATGEYGQHIIYLSRGEGRSPAAFFLLKRKVFGDPSQFRYVVTKVTVLREVVTEGTDSRERELFGSPLGSASPVVVHELIDTGNGYHLTRRFLFHSEL